MALAQPLLPRWAPEARRVVSAAGMQKPGSQTSRRGVTLVFPLQTCVWPGDAALPFRLAEALDLVRTPVVEAGVPLRVTFKGSRFSARPTLTL